MKAVSDKMSLWLVPSGGIYDCLSQVIAALSAKLQAPEFPPHVTLLPGCVGRPSELICRTARVASSLRPFVIRLGEIGFRDEHFRCLFLQAALTEALRNGHRVAWRAFGRGPEPAFMPHLSLLYGDFPAGLKRGIIAEIGPGLAVQFPVRSLHLYRTVGDPSGWRRLASFELGSGRRLPGV